MTVLQRAATIAAMSFALAGLIGTSSPGLATEIDRGTVIASPIVTPVTPLAPTFGPARPVVQPIPTAAAPVEAAGTAFDSLDAAVAAQDAAIADDALRCLAGAIYFEAKGEPLSGQLAVADVIINRTKSGRFPEDVCGVVKQHGQFSFVHGGSIPSIDSNRAGYRTAIAVAKVALRAAWENPATDALFFHARQVAPGWGMIKVAAIGNHIFYR
ncbi:cell wall hydrolase [Sphingomonas bacterium]|uniref:cell wall hydrolase n=1 Tax=Sphingomonas bacterium TaxID=1895847 RepID=UPI0015752C10|nr:cell wall hydrolase [Sphingomonas bacterium]